VVLELYDLYNYILYLQYIVGSGMEKLAIGLQEFRTQPWGKGEPGCALAGAVLS
jgi:hypothetical protein